MSIQRMAKMEAALERAGIPGFGSELTVADGRERVPYVVHDGLQSVDMWDENTRDVHTLGITTLSPDGEPEYAYVFDKQQILLARIDPQTGHEVIIQYTKAASRKNPRIVDPLVLLQTANTAMISWTDEQRMKKILERHTSNAPGTVE